MSDAVVSVRITGDPASFIASVEAAAAATDVATGEMDASVASASSGIDSKFSKLSSGVLGYVDNMFGTNFSKASKAAQQSMDDVGTKSDSLLGKFTNLGKGAGIALGVAAVATAAYAIDLGSKYQSLTTNIAAWGGISVKAAGTITQAFLATAGTTIYSASEIATAYGGVVGQLTAIEGHALNSNAAMTVMKAAMDLAEGSGESLGTATSALANVMQTFQLKSKDAASAADQLFATAKASGTGLSQVASSVKMVHTQLGALTPPLGQTGALLVDMVEHGMNGSRALRSLGTSMNALLKPGENVITQQNNMNLALKALPPSLQALGEQYMNGTTTAAEVTAATGKLDLAQTNLWKHLTTASSAYDSANLKQQQMGFSAFNAQGKYIGLSGTITDLYNQIKTLNPQQQLAKLAQDGLASSAAKLLPVIAAGPAAFDKATESVMKSGAAHDAAAKQAQTLSHQVDLLKATVKDWITSLGMALLPILHTVMGTITSVTGILMRHKDIVIAVGGVIATVLVAAIGLWVAGMVRAAAISSVQTAKTLANDAKSAASFVASVATKVAAGVVWIASNVAQAAAATAAFIAENAATLGIVAGIALLIAAVVFMATHWKQTWAVIKDVATTVWHFIDNDVVTPIVTFFTKDIPKAFDEFVDFLKKWGPLAAELILVPITGGLSLIIPEVISHWNQIKDIFSDAINDITGFFTALPGRIVDALGDIVGTIFSALTSAGTWIDTNVITPVINFFTGLPARIVTGLGNIVSTIFNGLLTAGSWISNNVIQPVVNYFTQLPGRVVSGLGDIIGTIFHGMEGAGSWINSNVIQPVIAFFTGLPGDILKTLGDLGTLLYNIGKSIITGLLNGLKSAYNDVKNFVGGIAHDIASLKGPISYDATLLTPHGNVIMQGLAAGLKSGYASSVAPMVSSVAGAISGGMNAVGVGTAAAAAVAGGGTGSSGASGGGGGSFVLQVNLEVDGQTFATAVTPDIRAELYRTKRGTVTMNLT